jgi:hypothetical protein
MSSQRHANWPKNSSKVREKWQRKIPGMPIYAIFGSPLLKIPRFNVPNGDLVFHGKWHFVSFFQLIFEKKWAYKCGLAGWLGALDLRNGKR